MAQAATMLMIKDQLPSIDDLARRSEMTRQNLYLLAKKRIEELAVNANKGEKQT